MRVHTSDVIEELKGNEYGYSHVCVNNIVNMFIAKLIEHVKNGDEVVIRNLVRFKTIDIEARTFRSSFDGREHAIPAHRRVTAKPSPTFKKA